MKLTIDKLEYELDVNAAIEDGSLKQIKLTNIAITDDEAAVLCKILMHVGGNPNNARGKADSVFIKIRNAVGNDIVHNSKLNLKFKADACSLIFHK